MGTSQTFLVCIALLALLLTEQRAHAVEQVWVGRSFFNDNWSDAANWDFFDPPGHFDSVTFGAAGSRLTPFVDYGVTLHGILFEDDIIFPAPAYTINGTDRILTLHGELYNNSRTAQRVNARLRLGPDSAIRNNDFDSGRLTIGGPVELAGVPLDASAGPAGIHISGAISGSGGLVLHSGTLDLTGNNSYTGASTVNSGTLRLSGGGRLPDATDLSLTITSTVLELVGVTDAINSLNGSGSVRVLNNATNTATLVIGVNGTAGGSGLFQGAISGTGGFTKRGTGTFRAAVPSTYTGDTRVEQGEFITAGLASATDLTVSAGAELTWLGPDTFSINSLNGAGTVSLDSARMILPIGAFGGDITGGGLTKRGPGLLSLSGSNTYFGETQVDEGTLQLTGAGRLADLNIVRVSSGAVFELVGLTDQVYGLYGAGTVNLMNNSTLIVGVPTAPAAPGNFTGVIQGAGGIVKRGAGTLSLSGPNTYSGNTVLEGNVTVTPAGASPNSAVSITVINGLYLMSGSPGIYSPKSLSLPFGTARLAAGADKLLRTANLTTGASGKLDLTDNDMIVTAGNLEAITTLIARGRNTGPGGLWSGNGITSSTAAARGHSLGAILNDNGQGQPLYPSFHGATGLSATDIIVATTIPGDLNLDGTVSIADFINLAAHFNETNATWASGDINYDRIVSISDLIDLASNFGATYSGSASLSNEHPLAVPEPAIMLPAAVALLSACTRRQKKKAT